MRILLEIIATHHLKQAVTKDYYSACKVHLFLSETCDARSLEREKVVSTKIFLISLINSGGALYSDIRCNEE
jgi:hypothetical protein